MIASTSGTGDMLIAVLQSSPDNLSILTLHLVQQNGGVSDDGVIEYKRQFELMQNNPPYNYNAAQCLPWQRRQNVYL